MKKLLREPLLHFLFIGAGLFVLDSLVGGGPPTEPEPPPTKSSESNLQESQSEPDREIVVEPGRIEQLLAVFRKTWQRPPTPEELKRLIDDFVLEEVYYREALAMGLDRDDTIIRRRLRQKMEFLTDDAASLTEPTDDELTNYLAEHPDKFRSSPEYTFRQIYFNPEKHGPNPEEYIAGQLKLLRSGQMIEGDGSLLLPGSFQRASRREVDGSFGRGFSAKLDDLAVGQWVGPVRSGLGLHLVHIDHRKQGRLPELDEIRPLVEREWTNARRVEVRRQFNESLLEKYDVTVQWPDEFGSAPPDEEGTP